MSDMSPFGNIVSNVMATKSINRIYESPILASHTMAHLCTAIGESKVTNDQQTVDGSKSDKTKSWKDLRT